MKKIITASPQEQLKCFKFGAVDIVTEPELLKKLEKSYETQSPLKIKAGFDPSRPDLHLGHWVLINKLKQFQDFGHQVIFLIGDFTALIGDPTGRNQTRPALSPEEIQYNATTYATQVFKILEESKTQICYNKTWFSSFTSSEFIKLSSQYTVARIMERNDFEKRFKSNQSIGIHEFLYPLVQGYDSVVLQADVELGGTDQKFNLLVGRDLQKSYGQSPQCLITVPILEGTDGVQKMSKSLDNFIALEDSPKNIFGKIMSISDELMFRYWELLTDVTPEHLAAQKAQISSGQLHPKSFKEELAFFIVKKLYDEPTAQKAQNEFQRIFSQGGLPDKIAVKKVSAGEIWICKFLAETGLVSSSSEARRMIQGHGVEWDQSKIQDFKIKLRLQSGNKHLLKVGKKKFLKIFVT